MTDVKQAAEHAYCVDDDGKVTPYVEGGPGPDLIYDATGKLTQFSMRMLILMAAAKRETGHEPSKASG